MGLDRTITPPMISVFPVIQGVLIEDGTDRLVGAGGGEKQRGKNRSACLDTRERVQPQARVSFFRRSRIPAATVSRSFSSQVLRSLV